MDGAAVGIDMKMRLTGELMVAYDADPNAMDVAVRRHFHIPENKYYCVSIYPDSMRGIVIIERERPVKAAKISKSDQAA